MALLALQTAKVAWRDVPIKQQWRASAEAVAHMPECADSPLPVVGGKGRSISGNWPARFYGYYLRDGAEREWLVLPRDNLPVALDTPPVADIIAARVSGTDSCPLLLWAVHTASEETMTTIRHSIEAGATLPDGARIVLRRFYTPARSPLRRLLGDNTVHDGAHQ